MIAHPDSPALAGIYLLSPTDQDMRHAGKRARGMRPEELTPPNRATRRRLARARQRRASRS